MPGIAQVLVFIRARVRTRRDGPWWRTRGPTRASPSRNGREKRIAPKECERNASATAAAVNASDQTTLTLSAWERYEILRVIQKILKYEKIRN